MTRLAIAALAAAVALGSAAGTASAQSPGASLYYPGGAPGLTIRGQTGFDTATTIRDPMAGSLVPNWLDRSSVRDPKAGTILPEGFARYSALTSAISPEPVAIAPSGTLVDAQAPAPTPVPTLNNSYGTPFRPYQAPTNAFSSPYTTFIVPSVLRPAPAAYGSAQIPSTIAPSDEAAADVASGEYIARPRFGNVRGRMGSNR